MKKIFKKIGALALTAVMSATMLAGCGGGSSGGGSNDKIKITVAINGNSNAESDLMLEWKVAYEAINPDVTISIKPFTSNYTQAMMNYLNSEKSMPDIMWTTGETHATWSSDEEAAFIDLKDMIDADASIELSDFYDASIQATHRNSKDDGIYFMPRDYNKPVLFINKAMFRAAGFTDEEIDGLKDGWDYEKFIATCERLKVAMQANMNTSMGVRASSVPLDAQMNFNASYCSFVKHFGGDFVKDGKVSFMSDENLNAYGQIFELIDNGYIAEGKKMASKTFTSLSAAMMINVRPEWPNMPRSDKYDIDFLPLPLDYVGVGCSGYAITYMAEERVSNSSLNVDGKSNKEYAFDFLKFIVSEEGQKIGAELGSIIPVRKSMADDSSWTTYMNAALNHAAFISAPEKDFSLSIFQDFDAKDSAKIMSRLAEVMGQVVIGDNYKNYQTNNYEKLRDAIKNFQSAVSDFEVKY